MSLDIKDGHKPGDTRPYTRQAFLQSGRFADAQIECDGKTWAVHRVIMCYRSKWFSKAFCGDFKEASDNKVILHDFSSAHIDWLLQYIYGGENSLFHTMTVVLDANAFAALCEAHRLGDYFDLLFLRHAAIWNIYRECNELLETFQSSPCGPDSTYNLERFERITKTTEAEFYSQFFGGVARAYEFHYPTSHSLQQTFAGIVKRSGFIMLTRPEFVAHLPDHPEFALRVLQLISSGFRSSDLPLPRKFPDVCAHCLGVPKSPTHFAYVKGADGDSWVEGLCTRCWELDEIEEDCNLTKYDEMDEDMG